MEPQPQLLEPAPYLRSRSPNSGARSRSDRAAALTLEPAPYLWSRSPNYGARSRSYRAATVARALLRAVSRLVSTLKPPAQPTEVAMSGCHLRRRFHAASQGLMEVACGQGPPCARFNTGAIRFHPAARIGKHYAICAKITNWACTSVESQRLAPAGHLVLSNNSNSP